MGLRLRKTLGTKHIKANISKKGYSSTSIKIAKGITYNTKRGLTLSVPGTGVSYNFGKKKALNTKVVAKTANHSAANNINIRAEKQKEYNKNLKEFTGGCNKIAIVAMIISFIICLTPIWPLGLFLLLFTAIWFTIDSIVKMVKFNKHLKETTKNR